MQYPHPQGNCCGLQLASMNAARPIAYTDPSTIVRTINQSPEGLDLA